MSDIRIFSFVKFSTCVTWACVLAALTLAGCGGGGGAKAPEVTMPTPVSCPDGSTVPQGDTCPSPSPKHTGLLLQGVNADVDFANGVAIRLLRAASAGRRSNSDAEAGLAYVTQTSYSFGDFSRLSFRVVPKFTNGELHFAGEFDQFDAQGNRVSSYDYTTDEANKTESLADIPATGWRGTEHSSSNDSVIWTWNTYSDIENEDDLNWLALGSWLAFRKTETDTGEVSVSGRLGFSATGNDPFPGDGINILTGQATYEGPALGIYMRKANASATPSYQHFTATANLVADFGDATAGGRISGSIAGGRTEGGQGVPDLTLESADIVQAHAGTWLGGAIGGRTTGNGFSGRWGAKLFGSGDTQPGSVAGTFGARTGDNLQAVLGAFAAYKE